MRRARLRLSRCVLALAVTGGAAAHAQDAPPPVVFSPSAAAAPGQARTNVEIVAPRKGPARPPRLAEPQAPASPQADGK
ncbi:MAG TPA: hypothetical protein VED87_08965 [Methylocystis sp.]|nr:hypothetical protein [Methylocystis sp.]